MTFGQKIKALTANRNRAEIARAAGLSPAVLNNYVYRNSEPLARAAVGLARALGVPLEWLLDDSQGLPAPELAERPSLRDATSAELLKELSRRYRLDLLETLDHAEAAAEIDWKKTAEELRALEPGEAPSPSLLRRIHILNDLIDGTLSLTFRYDPRVAADLMHDDLPGRDRSILTTNYDYLWGKFCSFTEMPGALDAIDAATQTKIWQLSPRRFGLAGLGSVLELLDSRKRVAAVAGAAVPIREGGSKFEASGRESLELLGKSKNIQGDVKHVTAKDLHIHIDSSKSPRSRKPKARRRQS